MEKYCFLYRNLFHYDRRMSSMVVVLVKNDLDALNSLCAQCRVVEIKKYKYS